MDIRLFNEPKNSLILSFRMKFYYFKRLITKLKGYKIAYIVMFTFNSKYELFLSHNRIINI